MKLSETTIGNEKPASLVSETQQSFQKSQSDSSKKEEAKCSCSDSKGSHGTSPSKKSPSSRKKSSKVIYDDDSSSPSSSDEEKIIQKPKLNEKNESEGEEEEEEEDDRDYKYPIGINPAFKQEIISSPPIQKQEKAVTKEIKETPKAPFGKPQDDDSDLEGWDD